MSSNHLITLPSWHSKTSFLEHVSIFTLQNKYLYQLSIPSVFLSNSSDGKQKKKKSLPFTQFVFDNMASHVIRQEVGLLNSSMRVNDILQELNPTKSLLDKYYPLLAILTLALLLVSLFLAFMITFYERYGMDPMKRGLQNRLISNFLNFGLIFIVVSIFQELYVAFVERNQETKVIYGFFQVFFVIGSFVVLNQVIFWKYMIKIVLKRLLAFNDDLIGVWLEITNLIVVFYLALVESFGEMFAMYFRGPYQSTYPPIHVLPILIGLLYTQCFIAITHSAVNYFKRIKNSNHQVNVIQINPPTVNAPPSFQFNNNPSNPELGTLKEFVFVLVAFTIAPLIRIFSSQLLTHDILLFFDLTQRFLRAISLLIPPLCYLLLHPKFRDFVCKFLTGQL